MKRLDSVEKHLFLEGIFLRYGYDFRQYAESSFDRRLGTLQIRFKTDSLLEILKKILDSADLFREILPVLTINTTEFFRDPMFFRALRETVLPTLQTYPRIQIWSAGCSTGEELLSVAMMLKEEGLYDRSTIYATDINPTVIKRAREGIYEHATIQTFNKNYVASGGTRSPSEYYTADYGLVRFAPDLLSNVVFSEHNLATDAVFVEAHLILCRNVLIYFTRDLQNRALQLFSQSLVYRGFLGLGSKESMRFSTSDSVFDTVDSAQRIYRFKNRPIHGAIPGGEYRR
ncbi:chemotaxis protein CheR [soil metagenome]